MNRDEIKQILRGKYLILDTDSPGDQSEYCLFSLAVQDFWEMVELAIRVEQRREVEFFLCESSDFNGTAGKYGQQYVIIINSAVISRAKAIIDDYALKLPAFIDRPSIEFHERLLLLFIMMHEYVHIIHGHWDYIQSNKANLSPHTIKTCEFDADCAALGLIYDYFTRRYESTKKARIKLAFSTAYLAIREFTDGIVGASASSSHPKFETRIAYLAGKVMGLDNYSSEGIPQDLSLYIEDQLYIRELVLDLESKYQIASGEVRSSKTFDIYSQIFDILMYGSQEFNDITSTWRELKHSLRKYWKDGEINDDNQLAWTFERGEFNPNFFDWIGS